MFIAILFGAWTSQMLLSTHSLSDCKKDMDHKACLVSKKIEGIAERMCHLQQPGHPDCAKFENK